MNLGSDTRSSDEVRQEYGLTRPWHLNFIKEMNNHHSFRGQSVLEIGGLLPRRFVLDYVGAKSWVNLNKEHFLDKEYPDELINKDNYDMDDIFDVSDFDFERPYQFINAGIEEIPESFDGQFDIVYSTATFEHVLDMGNCLDRSWSALKPGGLLISVFAPIWPSAAGHHRQDKIPLSDGRFFTIPAWAHLLYRPGEFYERIARAVGTYDAGEITYRVYFDNVINRMFVEDYVHFVNASKFTVDRFDMFASMKCPDDIQAKLEKLHPGRKYFSNSGIIMVLRKDA